jgi:arsenical pump membrane protein
VGVAATLVAGAMVVVLRDPALPVLATGAVAVGLRRVPVADAVRALNPTVLGGLFAGAVALGALARAWDGPARALDAAGVVGTAALGAAGSVLVNNLPAAVLLSARSPAHPRALLFGLDLGPNLAVTGSLSALLWWQAARSVGARPSALGLTRHGLMVVPASLGAALLATHLVAPGGL